MVVVLQNYGLFFIKQDLEKYKSKLSDMHYYKNRIPVKVNLVANKKITNRGN